MPKAVPFLRAWLIVVIAVVSVCSSINLLVDPYGIHRVTTIAGFNERKPRVGANVRLYKAYDIEHFAANALIIGNSRAEVGLNPSHLAWGADDRPVYNLAIVGSSIYLQYRYFQHALSVNRPRTIVMGIDFGDFLIDGGVADMSLAAEDRDFEDRLRVWADGTPNDARWIQTVEDMTATIFSLKALGDSLYTVIQQRNVESSNRLPLGFDPVSEMPSYIRREGDHRFFLRKDQANLMALAGKPKDIFVSGTQWSSNFETLRALIRESRQRGITLHLYIHPYHAHFLEVFGHVGLWSRFEEWKRSLARMIENESTNGDGPRVSLWDFSGYNSFTTEPVPMAGDRESRMAWYWDAGHYKSALGNLVLDRILGRTAADRLYPSFGVRLTADNVDAHILRVRQEREAYRAQNTEELTGLRELAQSLLGLTPDAERSGG